MTVLRPPSAEPENRLEARLQQAVPLLDSDLPQAQALAAAVLAEAGPESSAGGSAQHVLGTAECILGRIPQGRALLLQAAETLQRHGPAQAEMRAWRDYGAVLTILSGDVAAGIEAFQRALALAERLGLAAEEGAILARIGPALMRSGRMDDAERQLERAIALLQDGDDMHALATALDNLGWVLNRRGAFARALPVLMREHRLRLQADERLHTVNCEGNLAVTLAGLGRGDEAHALLVGIAPRLDPLEDHFPWADYLTARGSVCLLLGDAQAACQHLRAGLDVARRHALHAIEIDLWEQLTLAEERRGDLAAALACARGLREAERHWMELQATGRVQALEVRIGLAEQRAQNAALQQARLELEQRVTERTAALSEQVREREAAEALARYWADHDWLTRLPNRRRLQARLQEELAAASAQGRLLGLLFVDLDGFKAINDAHGHHVADRLLRRTAQRLRRYAPAGSFVARYGGDEFVVLLPGVASADAAAQQAEVLRQAVRAPMRLAGRQLEIACSIGVATGPRDATPGDSLLQHADRAMLEAKSAGRNQVLTLDAEAERRLDRRGQMRRELGQAIQAQGLHAVFQPIWDLQQQRLGGVELLARWQHPQLGAVSPAEFIPLAEESGLIHALGEWAVREAVAAARALRAALPGPDADLHRLRVSVNVSSLQLADPHFVETMLSVVQGAGGHAEWIEIELTESAQLAEDPATQRRMRQLREAGFALTIDDFGAGYSSFSYLGRTYFDRVKIDRTLVQDVAQSGDSSAVVGSIVLMAHRLGLAVVAEGIETPEQARWLEQLGCNSLQGFGIARPMPLEQLLRWQPDVQALAVA